MRNESIQTEFLETNNEIKTFAFLFLKDHQKKHQVQLNRGKPHKVYKASHKQVFHLNSKSQICHKSILQVISHQIKDNMHNHHGSIRLSKVGLCRKFGLRCVEASFMMMNQVDSSSFDYNKDDDKKPKRMISRLSQQDSRIKRSLISRFKRRNKEDFTREVLKRFFKK